MLEKVKEFIGMDVKSKLSSFTVIGKESKFEGMISATNLYVEGEFYPVKACSFEKLQISNSGVFCTESLNSIHNADDVEIAGMFTGSIVAKNIRLLPGAVINGKISYKDNFICDGEVVLNATINHLD